MSAFFSEFDTVKFAGPDTDDPMSYRWYDANRVVLGKPMGEHLRFAVAYWHSLAMNGSDPFGAPTLNRPWMGPLDPMKAAREKADAAFELFSGLLSRSFGGRFESVLGIADKDGLPDWCIQRCGAATGIRNCRHGNVSSALPQRTDWESKRKPLRLPLRRPLAEALVPLNDCLALCCRIGGFP